MKIYLSLEEIPQLTEPTSLTIGTFDGVHFGHHAILSKLKANSQHTALFTFINHPREILKSEPPPPLLSDQFVKFSLIEVHGIDTLISIPFTRELAELSYSDFLSLLSSKIPLSHLILGEGEAFGKNREGTPEKVASYAKEKGFDADYIPKKSIDGQIVSSSHIRALISAGDFAAAERFLGRPYLLSIQPHKRRIDASHLCLPPDGTYRFYSEDGEPISIQIETTSQGRWIILLKPSPIPTLIASNIIEEFYVESALAASALSDEV